VTQKQIKKRVSKDDWLKAALEVLSESGIESVKIEKLARRLGVGKAGFYWHFRDRQALLDAILEHWASEYTAVVAVSPEINALPAAQRLLAISEAVSDYDLGHYDLVISAWARHDSKVAERLECTYKFRLKFVRKAFAELGFRGNDLEMRTRLFVCYVSNEASMFGLCSSTKDRKIRELRTRLLTQHLTES
jgi:AcrR family transcriptional regulator